MVYCSKQEKGFPRQDKERSPCPSPSIPQCKSNGTLGQMFHLTYRPQANYRTQLILRARISFEEIGIDDPDRPQILVVKNTKIEDIIVAETLHCELVDAKILDCEQIDE